MYSNIHTYKYGPHVKVYIGCDLQPWSPSIPSGAEATLGTQRFPSGVSRLRPDVDLSGSTGVITKTFET